MKSWDVIIVGGGIIGLSISLQLRKNGASVLLVERGEPGHEASYAAAGMLVGSGVESPAALRPLAAASAALYPEFVHQLQDESGLHCDLRSHGTLLFGDHADVSGAEKLALGDIHRLEPALVAPQSLAFRINDMSVDPRALAAAALQAAQHRNVTLATGTEVEEVLITQGRVSGVKTSNTAYSAPVVINCAGCWAAHILPLKIPTRPLKGQMLSLVGHPKDLLRHVVRASEVYLVPRSDGRILAGATVEDVGYDKRTVPETIQQMHRAAVDLVPALSHSRMLEDWAGLRPGSPDGLPILGETGIQGYFTATGHFRDGILLAPITARIMAALISGQAPDYDVSAFSPARFQL